MENKKLFRVYTRRIALELRKRGFRIVKTEVNENFPQYDVYLFEDNEELRKNFLDVKYS